MYLLRIRVHYCITVEFMLAVIIINIVTVFFFLFYGNIWEVRLNNHRQLFQQQNCNVNRLQSILFFPLHDALCHGELLAQGQHCYLLSKPSQFWAPDTITCCLLKARFCAAFLTPYTLKIFSLFFVMQCSWNMKISNKVLISKNKLLGPI